MKKINSYGAEMICFPVIVFAYNRPEHLQRTLSALAEAECADKSPLIIFCDGPKLGQSVEKIDLVKAVANHYIWVEKFASVRVEFSETNLGLANSIINGVSSVLQDYDAAIVLEDDLIVAPDFLKFMNDCLTYYRADSRVGSVTGFCPLKQLPNGYMHDVLILPRNSSQGWAIWRDRWQQVDWDATSGYKLLDSNYSLRKKFNMSGSDRFDRLRRQLEGKIDSWSIRFGVWQFLNNLNTVYPTQNRIQNIGYDGSGIHSGHGIPKNDQILNKPNPYILSYPDVSPEVLQAFYLTYSGGYLRRIFRFLKSQLRRVKLL